MKTIFIIVALLFYGPNCICQQTSSPQMFTQEEYLKKSKRQKTTAWILLGGGVATSIIGLSQINLAGSDEQINNTPGTILFFTGLAATITSIPFFSASKKNRKKAVAVSSNIELNHSNLGIAQTLFKSVYPSLRVKVSF